MGDDSMLEPDFDEPYKAWKADPSPATRSKFLAAMEPDIDKAIQANVGRVDPLTRARGRRVALQALNTYDPSRGRLRTHLYNHMRTLKRYAGQQGMGVKVPERVMLDRRTLDLARQELQDDLGREPTDSELSEKVGYSSDRLAHIRKYAPALTEGYFASLGETGESGGGLNPAVQGPESKAWLQFVYEDLSPMDRLIMEYTVGMNGKPRLANQEIAKRLQRSPGLISQRKLMIQQLLNQEEQLSPFR